LSLLTHFFNTFGSCHLLLKLESVLVFELQSIP
jgi:hypothetical protein